MAAVPADAFAPTGYAPGLSRWPQPGGRRAAAESLTATSTSDSGRRESDRLALPGVQQPRENTGSDRVAFPADSGQRLSRLEDRMVTLRSPGQTRDLLYTFKEKLC